MVIVEKQRARDRIHAQVPGTVPHVELRERVIGVLQGAPVQPERRVAEQPSRDVEVEQEEQCHLHADGEEQLDADAAARRLVEMREHRRRAGLVCGCGSSRDSKHRRPNQIGESSHRHEYPVQPRQDRVPLRALEQRTIERADVVELLVDRAVARVMGEMKHALEGQRRREERRGERSERFVDAAIRVRDAVHRLVQEREHRVVHEGEHHGRDGDLPRRAVRRQPQRAAARRSGAHRQHEVHRSGNHVVLRRRKRPSSSPTIRATAAAPIPAIHIALR